jgi:phosphatidylinositol kinase/protein kinase (PI-3  family)
MMFEDKSHVSLEEIYVSMMQRKGIDPSTIAHLFQSEVRKRLEPTSDHPVDEEMARSAKLHAFQEVCRQVDDHILSDFIHRVFFSDAESLFKFRKVFTNQLAMNSLLQYAFDANDRNPSRFMFSVKTGQVLAPDFRFSYSNQGVCNSIGYDMMFTLLRLWYSIYIFLIIYSTQVFWTVDVPFLSG